MKNRLLSLLLVLIMVLGCLAGCGAKETATAETTTTETTTTETKTEETASAAEETSDNPYEGVVIKAICYEQDYPANAAIEAAINEKLGLTIEWVICPASEGWGAADRLLAADPTIDLLYLGKSRLQSYISKGYLYDLTEFLDQTDKYPNLAVSALPLAKQYVSADGGHYALIGVFGGGYGGTSGMAWAIREDWLAETGLPEPTTVDEMEAVLAAFKEMYPDKYPLFLDYSSGMLGALGDLMAGSFTEHATSWYVGEDGTLQHPILQPGMKDFVAKIKDWYDKGYLHPEFVTADTTGPQQLMASGECGVVAAWCTNAINPNAALMEEDPSHRFYYMQTTIDGTYPGKFVAGERAGSYIAINANTENIDACMYVLDQMSTIEMAQLCNWGIEGVNWNIVDGKCVRAEGDLAYGNQYNPYNGLGGIARGADKDPRLTPAPTGQHYTDAQQRNWYEVFYADARMEQMYFPAETGLIYDYSTGDNQFNDLNTVASTYISEMMMNMVLGVESLDNWDARIEELKVIALDQMMKERNEQWQKFGCPVYEWDGVQNLYEADEYDWMKEYVW